MLCSSLAHAVLVDIVVNQSDSPDPIAAGGLLTYTIVLTNNGPDDATGVALSDTIPATTSLSSVTTTKGSCTGTSTISCTIGGLLNGESATVTIKVIPSTVGTISNTATSTRNETDTNAANDADTDVTTVQAGTDLSISKTDSADPVAQGDAFSYALTARNIGPYALGASDTITVTDNVPTGLRVTSLPSGTGWSCSSSAGASFPQNGPLTLTCTRTGSLAIATNAASITVPVVALSLGTITNQATVAASMRDDNTTNNTVTQSTTVNQAADAAISKSISQSGNLGVNQVYTYTLSPTLVVGTTGTITVTDSLPSGVQLTATPTGTGWTCTPNSGFPLAGPLTVSCTRASASNSSTSALSLNNITLSIKPTATGTLNNTATINPGVSDPVSSNNTSNTVSSVVVNDGTITKTVSQTGNIGNGQTYTYTLQPVLNMGTTGTITVTDSFPTGASLLSAPTGTGWTCTPNTGFPLAGPLTISCTRASAGNAGPGSLSLNTISYTFKPTANGSLTNTATINIGVTDTTPANDSGSVTNTVINDAAITKTVSQTGNLGYNRSYTYTLQPVLNMGTTGTITVTDSFPAGAALTATPTGTGWTCTPNSGFPLAGPQTISCTRASAGNAGTGSLSLNNITVPFTTTATGTLTNTTSINIGVTDTTSSNDSGSVSNTVINDLAVAKSVSAASPLAVGTTYTYTLTPSLTMGDTGGTITMVDSFPTGARLNSLPTGTGWTCSSSAGAVFPQNGPLTITCTRATAVNSGAGSLALNNVTVSFTPTATGTLSNTVTISSPAAETNPPDNTATVSRTVTSAGPDLTISKNAYTTTGGTTAVANPTSVGTTFYYALVVTNSGATAGTAGATTTVTDIVPVGITVTGWTTTTGWTCTTSTGSFPVIGNGTDYLRCTRTGALAVGAAFSQIRFAAIGTVAGTVTNTATVATTDTEADTGNNSGSVAVTFRANYDLVISKSDTAAGYGPDPVAVGATLDYRLRVTNNGPDNVPSGTVITVTDTLPSNTTYISGVSATTGHTWTCPAGPISGAAGGVTVSCTRTVSGIGTDTLTNGGTSDIRFTVRADSGAGTTMTNNVRVDVTTGTAETSTANNTANQSTSVRGSADLSISKTASAASILANQNLTYTITVTNSASSSVATGASNVRVTDNMTTNPGATFVSVTPVTGTWSCNNNINLQCDLTSNLAIGGSASFQVTVKPTTVGTARSNTATVALINSGTTFPVDPDASNNTATVNVDVLTSVDLFVTKTDAPDPVRAGTTLTYVITVGNNGPGTATGVTMTDNLPANFNLTSITPSGSGSCTTAPASTTYTSAVTTVSPSSAFSTLTCTWATLASASQQTVTVIGKPTNAAYPAGLSNSVSVTHGNAATVPESDTSNNSVTQPTTVLQAQVDLLINKVDNPDPVARYTNTTYTVTVTNQGPSVATNVVVTENLPHTLLSYVSSVPSQGSCTAPVANVMTCNLGNLDVGASATITIVMNATALGTDTNTVSVTSSETDTNTANNTFSENTTVQLGADLLFSKLATPDPVIAGNAVFYFLKVQNNGPANAASVTITDTLPAGVSYLSAVASQGSCSHSSGVVTCNVGTVAYGKTAQVTLIAIAQVGGLQNNTATALATTPDPNLADNTATAAVTVIDGVVKGRVFRDDGLGTGNANDGIQSGSEVGIGNVLVTLTNCANTSYLNTLTDGNGDYSMIVPAALATGATLCVVETNLAGYRSTGGSAGTTGGTYSKTTDQTQFSYVDGTVYTGIDFADVAQSQLLTDGVRSAEPGASVDFSHVFIAGSDGSVSFALSATASPTNFVWSQVLYRDSNCNATIDPGEPVVSGSYTVTAGDKICLMVKEFVPVNATDSAQNIITLQSSFVYDTLTPTVTEVLTRNDITTVSVTDTLKLYKTVSATTALPGATLTYTITYRNEGAHPVSGIVINDMVPAYTHGVILNCILPLPSAISSCTPLTSGAALRWTLGGSLSPGASGQVSFTVTVDN